MNKKNIPLVLLTAIEERIANNKDLIKVQKEENCYYVLIDTEVNSNIFFKIYIDGKKRIGNFKNENYAFEFTPSSHKSITPCLTQGSLDHLLANLDTWLKTIKIYNEVNSVYDDPFTKKYSEFYYSEFKIIDDDADSSPFNPDQQDRLELYLNSLSSAIQDHEITDTKLKKELIQETKQIIESLNTDTKNAVMKKITLIFGKLYKHSKKFAKEIIEEAKKRLIKSLIELGVKYGPQLLESVRHYFEK